MLIQSQLQNLKKMIDALRKYVTTDETRARKRSEVH